MARLRRCGIAVALLVISTAGAQARAYKPHDPPQTAGDREQLFPIGATWVLQTRDGKPVPGEAPSFQIDDTLRATGFSGCNGFSMPLYPIKGQRLAAGAIAVTRKACAAPVLAAERAFLVGLHSLPTWTLAPDGDLTVKGATGVMRFRRGI